MSVSVLVPVIPDSNAEADEIVEINVQELSDNAVFTNGTQQIFATGIILDNDGTGNDRDVTIETTRVIETDGNDSFAVFEVRLTEGFSTSKTISYETSSGSATAGEDYVARAGSITFQAGQKVAFVTVQILGDDILEGDESFSLNLSGFVAGDLEDNATTHVGSGVIVDDDIFAESVIGTGIAETLTGTNVAERLFGLGGNDTIRAGSGNDLLFGGGGNDTLDGQNGDDEVSYSGVSTGVSVNLLSGMAVGDGTDTLISIVHATGGSGSDNIFGDNGAVGNILKGNAGDDVLAGRDGDDFLYGGTGNDGLAGGNGEDTLEGGSGDDRLFGGADNDSIDGGSGADIINGGSGFDLIYGGNNSDIALVGGGGNDTIFGGFGDDAISGSAGNDGIRNDLIGGDDGDDRIFGGTGNDFISGGDGNDLLSGGIGVDRFVFSEGFGRDTIVRYGEITSGGPRGDEIIDLSSLNVEFDDLNIIQAGNSTLISVSGIGNFGSQIELTFTNASTITEDDFVF